MNMSIATAIHTKRIVGTALKYEVKPMCFGMAAEPEYITCPTCGGSGQDEDDDECYNCDGDGEILNPNRLKSPRKSKITVKPQPGIKW